MKLPRRLRPLALVLLLLFLLGLLGEVYLVQASSRVSARKVKLEAALTATRLKINQAKDARNRLPKIEEELKAAEKATNPFPSQEENGRLADVLFQLARENHAEVISYSTAWTTETLGDWEYPVFIHKLELIGSAADLTSFLSRLDESSPPTLRLDALELTHEKGSWKLSLEAKLYNQPPPASKAAGTAQGVE